MRKNYLIALSAFTLSFLLAACEKEESDAPARLLAANVVITPPVSPSPLPTAGYPFNVEYNGQLLLNNITYGSASGVLTNTRPASKDSLALFNGTYAEALPGVASMRLTIAGSDPVLYHRTRHLEPGKNYTAIGFNLTPFMNVLVMEDNLTTPPPGKAHVRMVHAIPQELLTSVPRRDTVDMTFTGGLATNPLINSAIFANRRFADNFTNSTSNGLLTQFVAIDTGRYSLALRVAGTPGTSPATGLLAGWQTVRFDNQRIYTIIVRLDLPGLAVGRPVGLTVIRHN